MKKNVIFFCLLLLFSDCSFDRNATIGNWQDIHSEQDLWEFNPDRLRSLFHELDLSQPGLTKVNKKLYGIAVDCNCSSGGMLHETIMEFNELVKTNELNIQPIVHTYVLFRVNSDSDADEQFRQKGLFLHRYIDFDEVSKKELYSLSLILRSTGSNIYDKRFREALLDYMTSIKSKKIITL